MGKIIKTKKPDKQSEAVESAEDVSQELESSPNEALDAIKDASGSDIKNHSKFDKFKKGNRK